MHRSYSQRSEYLDCGWKYRLHRIVQLKERPAVWFPAGSAFHSVAETWARENFYGEPAKSEGEWAALYHNHFLALIRDLQEVEPDVSLWRVGGRKTKDKPNGEDIDWWLIEGPKMALNYILWRQRLAAKGWTVATIDGVPCIEMKLESMVGTTEVLSYVDLVLRDPTGIPVVIDLKTGTRVPDGVEQLGLYSVQLERVMNEPITWGAFYMARDGRATDNKDLSHFTEKNLGMIYGMLDRAIEAEIFAPHIGMSCGYCGYHDACIWWGNAEPLGERA